MADSISLKNHEYQQLCNRLLRIETEGKLYNNAADLRRAAYYIRNSKNVAFKRLDGFSTIWEDGHIDQLHNRIENAIAGFWNEEAEFVFVVCSDGKKNSFYIGASGRDTLQALQGVFSGSLLDVHFSDAEKSMQDFVTDICDSADINQSGIITGMPRLPVENSEFINPIETILSGMQGEPFCIAYLFRAIPASTISQELTALFAQKATAAKDEQYSLAGTSLTEKTFTIVNYSCKQYIADLEQLEKHLLVSRETGAWETAGFYITNSQQTAKRLSSLIRSAYGGKGSGPEPLNCRAVRGAHVYAAQMCFIPSAEEAIHPLAPNGEQIPFTNPFCTQLSSKQAATLLMLPSREMSGFYVNTPSFFDLTNRNELRDEPMISLGDVLLTAYAEDRVGEYSFPIQDFSRHALIVGATGGGKSNTIRSMLLTLSSDRIRLPFLVIESAKSEYWQLSGFSSFNNLCVMSLGEMSSPFRLNPFECTVDFSLQTHVDSLLSTFKAAFEMYTPMPFILEQAVYEVYADYGWDIAAGKNLRKVRQYPTLSDLYWQIPITVEKTAYDKEIKDNVSGALQTRVRSLMIGGKGQMMNTRKSTPLDKLLSLPVVLELESLGDDETKAFVMGLLMNRLYEFRLVESAGYSRPFKHLLIIEEAHRLLKNVPQGQDSSRAASVEFFCNMLSEIRSYGQGIMIADQSPVKLAQDSLRNTNLKIVHRIVDQDDRNAVGGAMHMEDSQKEALTVLRRGVAAVYSEGDNRPKLVKFPLVKSDKTPARDKTLANAVSILRKESTVSEGRMIHAACRYCPYAGFRGMCTQREYAEKNEQTAQGAFQNAPEAQRADYIDKYSQYGPNALLTDAIVLYALRKEMAARGIPEESQEKAAWDEEAARKLCIAGFTLQQLSALKEDMVELIAARYDNLLQNRT